MPKHTSPIRSTAWLSRAWCGVILAAAVLSACQAASTPVPTPQCVRPTLTLGSTQFPIESLARAADGSIALPAPPEVGDKPGAAFWIEGTNINYVFALVPAPGNLALKETLKPGDEAKIVWANCNSSTYALSEPEPGPVNESALLEQSASGITVYVKTSSPAEGFVIKGELAEQQLKAIDTPQPGAGNIQAEVSLLETTTSADKATLRVGVSILNTGAAPFSLSAKDVSLASEDAAPVAPTSAEPSLPHDFQPGKAETIIFTFPRPLSNAAIIKILDAEFDLEGF